MAEQIIEYASPRPPQTVRAASVGPVWISPDVLRSAGANTAIGLACLAAIRWLPFLLVFVLGACALGAAVVQFIFFTLPAIAMLIETRREDRLGAIILLLMQCVGPGLSLVAASWYWSFQWFNWCC